MKVLIFTHTFAPNVGGVETYLHLLAEGLVALPPDARGEGIEVTVATRTPRGDHADGALPYTIARNPSLAALAALMAGADVVHLGGPAMGPLALALALRRPVVVEHHAYQAICPNGLLLREPMKSACDGAFMARRYGECARCVSFGGTPSPRALAQVASTHGRRLLLARVDANVGVSAHVARRIELPRAEHIHHGIVDPFAGRATPLPPPPIDAERGPCFAYVGRLVSEKGLGLLVGAAATLHREGRVFRVRFVGDGPEREGLASLAASLGVSERVEWTGFVRGAAFEAAIADVTAVVMPSVWEETAGLAAIEQMMRGRVVVASRTGGLAEIVDDAGLRFEVGDADALADCLRRLIVEDGLAASLGRAARDRAARCFTQRRMAEEHRALYRRAIDRHRR